MNYLPWVQAGISAGACIIYLTYAMWAKALYWASAVAITIAVIWM
jgi:hypothetical protein